jgi:hypothetical protein
MRITRTLLLSVTVMLALAGCGSGDSSEPFVPANRVAYGAASKVKSGMSRPEVNRLLGRPALTSRAAKSAPGGCVYYAMQGQPLADVWQFCFDKRNRVSSGATLYAVSQPPPPSDASPQRGVLIGRGDTICQAERADLAHPVKRLNRQLTQVKKNADRASRLRAAKAFGPVEAVLGKTLSQLGAFEPPADERSTFAGYLAALRGQVHVLPHAATAVGTSQDQRYTQLLERFNALSASATAQAHLYGFSACAGITFS